MAEDDPLELLAERLAGAHLPTSVAGLVLAAALGNDQLDGALGGQHPQRRTTLPAEPSTPSMYLTRIAVAGFRGIAGETFLGLRPGPGLTLVIGRNGSGKSSFAEAAELAFTGTSSRWSGRTRVWETGWANLHHQGGRSVEVRGVLDGVPGELVVRRTWDAEAALAGGRGTARRQGQPTTPIEELGLDSALSTWRPFLSYNELGGLLDEGPSRLYDAVSAVLGLEEWVEAERRLSERRKKLEDTAKAARAEADRLRGLLTGIDDERATRALAAIPARRTWDLTAIEELSTGIGGPGVAHTALEQLAAMPLLDLDDIGGRATALRLALERTEAIRQTDAGRARALADLLERARDLHRHEGNGTCPVCGTADALDDTWRARTSAEIERLRHEAGAADQAANDLARAVRDARSLLAQVTASPPTEAAGVDTAALGAALGRWADAPHAAPDLVRHLEDVGPEVVEAIGEARDAAAKELQRRQDAWQPVAAQLAAWLPNGRAVQQMRAGIDDLKAAASWLADETTRVRNERFVPIADQVKGLWDRLRFTSNVSLDGVNLEGARTRRRVELSVSVDDTPGAALSVMSQGELHCLALSLFLPRAMLSGSPFRFLVIDDPVQAMDANRIDGLATVLAHAAGTHQVIVFTHDERLPAAARRLGITARVLEVTRGERSNVTVRPRGSPLDDYLADARALLATADYPEAARRRVVPGLCRNALEAACLDTTHRRFLLQGRSHAQIEVELERAGKLLPRLALALFSDAGRAGDVLADVNRRWGRTAGDCVQALQRGSHRLIDDEPELLVSETARIARGILDLA